MAFKSSSFALDPKRHDFQTNFGLVLTVVTMVLFGVLSVVFAPPTMTMTTTNGSYEPHHDRYLVQDGNNDDNADAGTTDYSSYSCHDLYDTIPQAGDAQCAFARTCNSGEGIWAPFVFCSSWMSRQFLMALLSPVVVLWLVLLFRMLGSTAEDYFSPALEMFAVKLQLPPRFAGVSLLALGNGAADVSATVSAITADPEHGYKLALGALTGAAMVIGAVVSAVVVLVAEGLPCRGALVRDVAALGLSVLVVWHQLASGVVTPETVTLFLAMYVIFVMLVLLADIYHRAVVIPRRVALQAQRERERQMQSETLHVEQVGGRNTMEPPESKFSHVLTAFSNYDNPPPRIMDPTSNMQQQNAFGSEQQGMGVDSDILAQDAPIMLHGAHGILTRQHHHNLTRESPSRRVPTEEDEDDDDNIAAYGRMGDDMDEPDGLMREVDSMCVDRNSMAFSTSASWGDARDEATDEVRRHVEALWDDVAYNGDLHVVSKYLLLMEFPVTLLRQFTVPLPCEGYYNRGMTALSLALSPIWMAYYLHKGFDVPIFSLGFIQFAIVCFTVAILVLRMAPQTPAGSLASQIMPNLWVATPVALYGFVIAAAWIDTIADELVSVLDFVGICLKIPGPIVGLTILAWGNSMSDLSADITMARKGLANMAMTACFAGPLFNILVGLGFGFSTLAAKTGVANREVTVSASAATGFLFIALNSLVILYTGLGFGTGTIPKKYGYIAVSRLRVVVKMNGIHVVPDPFIPSFLLIIHAQLTLYSIYLIASITLQYTSKNGDDDNA